MIGKDRLKSVRKLIDFSAQYLPESRVKVPVIKENKAFKKALERYRVLSHLNEVTWGHFYNPQNSMKSIKIDSFEIMSLLLRISQGEKEARRDLFLLISPILMNMPGYQFFPNLIRGFLEGNPINTISEFEQLFSLLLSWWYVSGINKIKSRGSSLFLKDIDVRKLNLGLWLIAL